MTLLAHWLIVCAGTLVPRASRNDWRSEWEAELFSIASLLETRGMPSLMVGAQLVRFAAGSLRDALWHWRNSLDANGPPYRHTESPGFCLTALLLAILAIAAASGGLPATRAALLPLAYEQP